MQTMIRELNLKNFTKRKENNMLRVYGNKQKNELQRELYVEPLDGSMRQLAQRLYERARNATQCKTRRDKARQDKPR